MAKEDFCFTFYDGDATRDASHMNRLERGGYYDIIIAQRKFGRLTQDQIKKILGKDFDELWPAIELILEKSDDKFYVKWLEDSISKMKEHSRNQSMRGKKGGRPKNDEEKAEQNPDESQMKPELKPNNNQTLLKKSLKEDGNGNEDVNEDVFGRKGVQGENIPEDEIFSDFELWTQMVLKGEDQHFEQMLMGENLNLNGQLDRLARDYLGLLAEYPNKAPTSQQKFRHALMKHIREKIIPDQSKAKLSHKSGPSDDQVWTQLQKLNGNV